MTFKKTLVSALAISGVLAMAGGANAADEYKLGYLMAKTGPFASISETNEIAADMAVEEINAAGGINGKPIRLIKFDTSGKPDQAVIGVRKLAQDENVLGIIGPFSSGEAKVAFPAGERLSVVTMPMASSSPNLAEPYKYAFRNTTNEAVLFARLLEALKSEGYDTNDAAVAYATDDAISVAMGTKLMPALLEKAGIPVKSTVDFKLAAFDYAPQVSQLAADPTDLVAVGSPPDQAVKLVQEMRRQGHDGRIIAGSTVSDPDLPERMGEAGNGTVIPTTFYANLNDETKAFAAAFSKRAGETGSTRTKPSQFDAATYGIVQFYADALDRADPTGDADKVADERAAVRDALAAMQDFPALEGSISFGADGDALKPVYIVAIEDGDWTLVKSYEAARPE